MILFVDVQILFPREEELIPAFDVLVVLIESIMLDLGVYVGRFGVVKLLDAHVHVADVLGLW